MCDLGTRDLQTLTKTLLAGGALTTPPVHEVARRARHAQQRRARTAAVGALALALVVTVSMRWAAHEPQSSRLRVVDRPTTSTTAGAGPSAGADDAVSPSPSSSTTSTTVPIVHTPRHLACAPGLNGGATDRGVTGDRLRVTMTETLRFPDRYTTVTGYEAVKAVFANVNATGGICGRLLDVALVNPVSGRPPWHPESDAVAGIGGPLDENVDAAIADGSLDRSRTPLLTTGVTPVHFRSAWVWPVLPPAQTITRVAVDHAYKELGARTFALVHADDAMHRQAAPAFTEYVATLPGASVVHVQPLDSGEGHEDDAAKVARACGPTRCDFVLLALSAHSMSAWHDTTLVRGRLATAGFPSFARSRYVDDCVPLELRLDCSQVHVWTGPGVATLPGNAFKPIPDFDVDVGDVTLADSARVGAERLVEAVRRVGPNVTRERLRAALDQVSAELSLVRWETDGGRVFDIPVRAWRPTAHEDAVIAFSELLPFTGWLRDPYTGWMER